jgi:hypothetical protein
MKVAFSSVNEYIELGSSIIGGIIQGISDGANELLGVVGGLAGDMLNAIKDGLGIASPSKEAIKISEQFMQGLEMGIEDSANDFQSSLTNLFALDEVQDAATQGAAGLSELFASAFQKAERFASQYFNTIRDEAGNLQAFSIFGGEAIDVNDQLVLGRINALDVLNKQQDALGLQLRLFDKINRAGLDFEALTHGIETGPQAGIIDMLELEVRINRELVKQDEERLALAEKQAKLAEKEAELKKLQQVQQVLGDALSAGLSVSGNIVNGITLGLETSQADLLELMIDIADNQVKAMEDSLGIESPSKRFADIGRQSMEGVIVGAKDMERQAIDKVRGVASSMIASPVQPSDGLGGNNRLMSMLSELLSRPSNQNDVQINNKITVDNQMRAAQMGTMFENQLNRAMPQ